MRISAEQVKVFTQVAWQGFENEMLEHSEKFAPALSGFIGKDQLRVAVRAAIAKARSHGFTNRGPVRLYVELTLLCGSSFDTDPQYGPAGEALRTAADQMTRAEKLHAWHNACPEDTSSEELQQLASFLNATQLAAADLRADLQRTFPGKARNGDASAITMSIERANQVMTAYGMTNSRTTAFMAGLLLVLGHGCVEDPLYPWIADSLRGEKATDGATRALLLEQGTGAWLQRALASESPGACE